MKRNAMHFIGGLILAFLCAWSVWPVGAARADAGPTLAVQWGFGGQPLTGETAWMPVIVSLTGGVRDLDATLVVDPAATVNQLVNGALVDRNPQDQGQVYLQRSVHLAAGARQRVVVWVPVRMGWLPRAQLKQGSTVLTQDQIRVGPDAAGATGLILAPEGDLTNLGALTVPGKGQVRWARLSLADMPETALQLAAVDVIVLGRVDTRAFTPGQKDALTGWVAAGGQLVVTGGPEAATAAAGLPPELLPVRLGDQVTADVAPLLLLDSSTVGTNVAATPAPVARLAPQAGSRVVAGTADMPLAVRRTLGLGNVLYLAVDPSLAPLAGDTRFQGALTALLTGKVHPTSNMQFGAFQQLFTQMAGLRMPSGGVLLLLLLGYLILLGPVQYLVLKRLDRRELAWVTTPVLAVLLLGATWVSALGNRGLMTSTNTATEVLPDQPVATVQEIAGFFSPARRTLTVKVAPGSLAMAPNNFYNSDQAGPLREGDTLRYSNLSDYRPSGLMVSRQARLAGPLRLTDIRVAGGQITAAAENQTGTALHEVYLVSRYGSSVRVGDLAPGAKQTVSIAATALSPNPAMIGKGPMPVGMPIIPVTPNQVWRGPQDGPPPWLRGQLVQELLSHDPTSSLADLWLVGFADRAPVPWGLDLPQAAQGVHMVFSPVSLVPTGSVSELPMGLISGAPSDGGVRYGQGVVLADAGEHTAVYHLPELAATAGTLTVRVTAGQGGSVSQVRVRNWRTNAWDSGLDVSAADHVGPGGLVQVRFTADGTLNLAEITLAVGGGK